MQISQKNNSCTFNLKNSRNGLWSHPEHRFSSRRQNAFCMSRSAKTMRYFFSYNPVRSSRSNVANGATVFVKMTWQQDTMLINNKSYQIDILEHISLFHNQVETSSHLRQVLTTDRTLILKAQRSHSGRTIVAIFASYLRSQSYFVESPSTHFLAVGVKVAAAAHHQNI